MKNLQIEGGTESAGLLGEIDSEGSSVYHITLQHLSGFHSILSATGIDKSKVSFKHDTNYVTMLREKLTHLRLASTWTIA